MNYYYSALTNAFYPETLLESYKEAGTLPDDIQALSEDVFREFTATPPEGKRRVAGEEGLPVWDAIPPVVFTEDEVKSRARRLRDSFITATDTMLVADYSINDIALTEAERTELLSVRQDFKKWPNQEGWPAIELPKIPQWLLIEAANNGYIAFEWPEN